MQIFNFCWSWLVSLTCMWPAVGQMGGSVSGGWLAVGWAIWDASPSPGGSPGLVRMHLKVAKATETDAAKYIKTWAQDSHTTQPPYSWPNKPWARPSHGPFQTKRRARDTSSREKLESTVAIFSIDHREFCNANLNSSGCRPSSLTNLPHWFNYHHDNVGGVVHVHVVMPSFSVHSEGTSRVL